MTARRPITSDQASDVGHAVAGRLAALARAVAEPPTGADAAAGSPAWTRHGIVVAQAQAAVDAAMLVAAACIDAEVADVRHHLVPAWRSVVGADPPAGHVTRTEQAAGQAVADALYALACTA